MSRSRLLELEKWKEDKEGQRVKDEGSEVVERKFAGRKFSGYEESS